MGRNASVTMNCERCGAIEAITLKQRTRWTDLRMTTGDAPPIAIDLCPACTEDLDAFLVKPNPELAL